MTRLPSKVLGLIFLVLVGGANAAHAQSSPGPQGPEEGVIRRQLWLVPAQDRRTLMRTSVFRPPGAGPFPLAVINHGSSQNEMRRAQQRLPEYQALTLWLVERGYAVAVPQRPGHGETGGPYYENLGECANANHRQAGLNVAASAAAAVDFMARQPFVRKTGAVVLGHSTGGWGALALTTYRLPQVKAVVAFAAGMGGRIDDVPGRNCAPERLVDAARSFGEKSRVPTLWLYAENDSFFGPALSKRLADAFRLAGGRAEYRLLPALVADGHDLIHAAPPIWGQAVDNFLASVR